METLKDKQQRQYLLGQIHRLARSRFGKSIGMDSPGDTQYRDWLEKHFRERSCVAMTNETLTEVLVQLNMDNYKTQDTAPKITKAQYLKITHLCKQMGWDGFYDVRFRNFCERTVREKTWTTEFDILMLRRSAATAVINGLTNWVKQIQRPFECHLHEPQHY